MPHIANAPCQKMDPLMADLNIEMNGRVLVATLNRPEVKNAFSEKMLSDFIATLERASADPEIGCVVLTGAGDVFCSGGDLGRRSRDEAAGDPTPLERRQRLQKVTHRVAQAVERFDKPLICAVNGAAVGAGMDLSLMCDIRFAGQSARFAERYIRVGLLPGNGGAWFLPRLVGPAKALELLWTGDFVDATEAMRIGIVNRIHADADLLSETLVFAQSLAEGPPLHIRDIKVLMNQSLRTDLRTSLEMVASQMAVIQCTDDYREAISAFKEKRKPVYRGT